MVSMCNIMLTDQTSLFTIIKSSIKTTRAHRSDKCESSAAARHAIVAAPTNIIMDIHTHDVFIIRLCPRYNLDEIRFTRELFVPVYLEFKSELIQLHHKQT